MEIRYLEVKWDESCSKDFLLKVDTREGDHPTDKPKYDESKSFFRNFINQSRYISGKNLIEELKKEQVKQKKQRSGHEREQRSLYLQSIFKAKIAKIRPLRLRQSAKEAHNTQYLQDPSSRISEILGKQNFNENQLNKDLKIWLQRIKQLMDDEPAIRKIKDDQFGHLVKIFLKANNLEAIIKNTFSLIINFPNRITDGQKIFFIKLIRCFLSESFEINQQYKFPVDEWDTDYTDPEEEADREEKVSKDLKKAEASESLLRERQQLIERCGGSDLLNSILKEDLSNRIELLNETLLFGIIYLFNGNEICQKSLLNVMRKDRNNLMLATIYKLILTIQNYLISIRSIAESDQVAGIKQKIVDTYDYYSSDEIMMKKEFGNLPNDKYEIYIEDLNQKALCRVFRFLQLFCENNNRQTKNFLRNQITVNEKGKESSNKQESFDFITLAINLLRKLLKNMNNKLVNIPAPILDFLIQVTQIPCLQNMTTLMKSTFFEDLSYMADFFENEANLKHRKFTEGKFTETELMALSDIYLKGLILSYGNFEGNITAIYQEFLNKCKPKLLWIVIRKELGTLFQKHQREVYKTERWSDLSESSLRGLFEFYKDDDHISEFILFQKSSGAFFCKEMKNVLDIVCILKKICKYQPNKSEGESDKTNSEYMKRAIEFQKKFKGEAESFYPKFPALYQRLKELILNIEVLTKDKDAQTIYFPQHPLFMQLTAETRNNIMMTVERGTQADKLSSLVKTKEEIKQDIYWTYNLCYKKTGIWPFPITSKFYNNLRSLAGGTSIIIIILIYLEAFQNHDLTKHTTSYIFFDIWASYLIIIFKYCQLILTIVFVFLWAIARGPLAYRRFNSRKGEVVESDNKADQESALINRESAHGLNYSRVLIHGFLNRLSYSGAVIGSAVTEYLKETMLYLYIVVPISALFYEKGFLSIFMFAFASFMGFMSGVEWYAIHLFDILVERPQANNISKAVLNNIAVLCYLSLFSVAFTAVFTVLSLSAYVPVMYEEQIPKDGCQEMLKCIVEMYTSGVIKNVREEFDEWQMGWDMLWVVFIDIIVSGLVRGIITDGFFQLKRITDGQNKDKRNKCYICGQEKQKMEKVGKFFNTHIRNEHFLWHYIFYIIILRKKSSTEYSGVEYNISENLDNDQYSWFPSIENISVVEELQPAVYRLQNALTNIQKNLQSLTKSQFFSISDQSNEKEIVSQRKT